MENIIFKILNDLVFKYFILTIILKDNSIIKINCQTMEEAFDKLQPYYNERKIKNYTISEDV